MGERRRMNEIVGRPAAALSTEIRKENSNFREESGELGVSLGLGGEGSIDAGPLQDESRMRMSGVNIQYDRRRREEGRRRMKMDRRTSSLASPEYPVPAAAFFPLA
jgi:hypothetical protein